MGWNISRLVMGCICACLPLMQACSNQETEAPWEPGPYLNTLSLYQVALAGGDTAFQPRDIPMSPESQDAYHQHYAGRVYPGVIALVPGMNLRTFLTVRFHGAKIPEDTWPDGRPAYRIPIDSAGDAELVLEDSANHLKRTYRVSLSLRSLGEAGETSLKEFSLDRYVYSHGNAHFSPIVLSPAFHPDSLEYLTNAYEFENLRLAAIPLDPFSEVVVRLGESVLEARTMFTGQPGYFTYHENEEHFRVTVTHLPSGRTRTYSLDVALSPRLDR